MNFPVLSVIVFTPMVAAVLILLMPANKRNETRALALAAATFALALSAWVYIQYLTQGLTGYQFVEEYSWLPALGMNLIFGVDGMSAPLVLLTGIVMFTGVLISWGIDDAHAPTGIQDRPREFFAFLFILASGVFGVFASLDLFMLFFFYEIAVFPMYLLIAIWGWVKTREYAAMKLTLYLFIGSVVALVGALAMYYQAGFGSFDMRLLETANFPVDFQVKWFLPVFFGFAVLGGIWPFHNWSPDGHVAAPTAVSMFHAGVLMKLGAFAALRVGVMLLPQGAQHWSWVIMTCAGVAVVYGAFIAFVQPDLKYIIGFSSVSHMGLVMLGISTLNRNGLTGAGIQMFSHGVMTALFFAMVGSVYDQAHTRDMTLFSGLVQKMPFFVFFFGFAGLASVGLPALSGFVAEFNVFVGTFKTYPWAAALGIFAAMLTAVYILRMWSMSFFGAFNDRWSGLKEMTYLERGTASLLAAFILFMGLWPAPFVDRISETVRHLPGVS